MTEQERYEKLLVEITRLNANSEYLKEQFGDLKTIVTDIQEKCRANNRCEPATEGAVTISAKQMAALSAIISAVVAGIAAGLSKAFGG